MGSPSGNRTRIQSKTLGSLRMEVGHVTGPASYSTGGFEVDLTDTDFSNVAAFFLELENPGTFGPMRWEVSRNLPMSGKVKVKLAQFRYDRTDTVGNVTGAPSGVAVQASSGATTASQAAHTHAPGTLAVGDHSSHTHTVTPATSADPDAGVGGPAVAAPSEVTSAGPSLTLVHSVSGATGSGGSHSHADNNLYQHQHLGSVVATDLAVAEVGNGQDCSSLSWTYIAVGV